MRKLRRYISATITASILMVLAVIIGLDSIAAIIDQMGQMSANYDFLAVLRFVAFSIPGSIFDLLPFAALVGCLAGLGMLANNSELVVMRSAGVSTKRVVWMVMRPALVIMLLGMLISEYVAPHTQNIAQSERSNALLKNDNLVSRQGLWHREGNQFLHFNVVQPNGILYGVTIYSFDDEHRLLNTGFAKIAIYQSDYWLLENVSESHFTDDRVNKLMTLADVKDILEKELEKDEELGYDKRLALQHAQHFSLLKIGDAKKLIDELLLQKPDRSEFIWLKGNILHKLQRSEEALLFLKEADERSTFNHQLKNDIREVEDALGF